MELTGRTLTDEGARWELPHHVTAPRGFRRHVVEMRPGVLVSARVAGEERGPRPQAEKRRGRILYRSPAKDPGVSLRFLLGLISALPGAAVVEEAELLAAPRDGAAMAAFAVVCFASGVVMDLITGWHARQPPWLRRAVWAAPSAAAIVVAALFTPW